MTIPKRKLLIQLITLTLLILISIIAWTQYQKYQDANRYVSAGKSPDRTLLMRASNDGDLAQVQSLLDRGADITLTDGFDRNALYFAISGGNHDIVRLLLNSGVDINHFSRSYIKSAPCTLSAAVSRSPSSPEDYELFSELVNHTPHDLSNHYCSIALHTTTQGRHKYLELFLSSLDPEWAASEVGGVRATLNMGNNWLKNFEELDPDIRQKINDTLSKYE